MYEHRSDPRIEEHADVYVKVQSAPDTANTRFRG